MLTVSQLISELVLGLSVRLQACPPTEIADISRGKRKPCACGSTTHSRKTSKSCPLNISNVKSMQAPHREHLESKVIVEEPNDASNLDLTDEFEHSEVLSELEGLYSDDSPLPSSDEDEFDDFESLIGICECGRAHKRTCPLNPRFLSQDQKRGNGPKGDEVRSRVGKGVASKSSAVRRGSDTLSGPPVKKAKVVTQMSTRVRRPITPSKSPVSRPSMLGKSRARVSRDLLCAGSKTRSSNDIEADEHSSNIEAGPRKVPKTTDVALSPKCPPTDIEDVAIVGCDPPKDFDFSLSPTPEWREEAIKCIEKFSGRTISPVVAESNNIITWKKFSLTR